MRVTVIISLLLLVQNLVIKAQDFRLIIPGQEKQYYRDGDRIYSPEINSIEQNIEYININFDGITVIDEFANCYFNKYHDILGSTIVAFETGENGIVLGGTFPTINIQIRTNAATGESWTCIDYDGDQVTATCKSIQQELVNGQMELVKTICFDNDYCDLKISQHQGIISTPTWNRLPLHWWGSELYDDQQAECLERIWDEELLEKFNVPFGDLASDLQEGDVLHIEESFSQPPSHFSRKLIKARFIEKTFDTLSNSYHLTFSQEVDEWKNIEGNITQKLYIDTALSVIGRHLLLDSREFDYPVPLNRIFHSDSYGEFVKYSIFNDKLIFSKSQLSFEVVEGTECFPFIYDIGEGYNYIEGLAGPYYKHAIFYERERSLKYYKKGNEEWGEPFTFTVSTSEKIIPESVSIFPNPVVAGSQIFLQDLGGKEMLEIHLVDLYGQQVQSWQLKNTTNQESLELQKNIPAGMYVLWIKENEKHQYYSKLVIR